MATVLWYQGEMDEERVLMENKIYWANDKLPIVRMLYRYAYASIETETMQKMRYRGYDISNNIRLLYTAIPIPEKKNITYIQSCFTNRDRKKRKMPFMYYTDDCIKIDQAVELLVDCARMINKRCSTDEINYFIHINEGDLESEYVRYIGMQTKSAKFSYLPFVFGMDYFRKDFAYQLFKQFNLKTIPCGSINLNEEVVDYTRERTSQYSYK